MGIEAGDIIFVRGSSPISSIIRYFDKGEFSHVAVAVSDTHIIEAEWNTKSVIKPFKYEDYEVIKLGLTDEQKYALVLKAIQLTGLWYDYLQLLTYIFTDVKLGSPKSLICSELSYHLLKEVGIDVQDSQITPNELYRHLTLMRAG
jgi:Permuted papain-like amidase enzyme, YaeF/YiiX, C92 family